MKDKRIGFVGLGRMGANMARCLKDKGYNVVALIDIKESVATNLAAELGATAYTKLADVTANADIILTVVTNDQVGVGATGQLITTEAAKHNIRAITAGNRVISTDRGVAGCD